MGRLSGMGRMLVALGYLLSAAGIASAQVPNWPQTLGPNTVIGRLNIGSGPAQAIPFGTLTASLFSATAPLAFNKGTSVLSLGYDTNFTSNGSSQLALANCNANTVIAGPSSGSAAEPGCRGLVVADLPAAPSSWFDEAYCSTVGYLIVRFTGQWTCSQSMAMNITWWGASTSNSDNSSYIATVLSNCSGGGKIWIPIGQFKFASPQFLTTSYCVIEGAGEQSQLIYTGTGIGFTLGNGGGGVTQEHLHNFYIGCNAACTAAYQIVNAQYGLVHQGMYFDAGASGTESVLLTSGQSNTYTAASSWTTAATTITLTTTVPAWVIPGTLVYDTTNSEEIGTVLSISGDVITLTAAALSASSGSSDSLRIGGINTGGTACSGCRGVYGAYFLNGTTFLGTGSTYYAYLNPENTGYVQYITFEDCEGQSAPNYAIYGTGAWNITVRHCHLERDSAESEPQLHFDTATGLYILWNYCEDTSNHPWLELGQSIVKLQVIGNDCALNQGGSSNSNATFINYTGSGTAPDNVTLFANRVAWSGTVGDVINLGGATNVWQEQFILGGTGSATYGFYSSASATTVHAGRIDNANSGTITTVSAIAVPVACSSGISASTGESDGYGAVIHC